MKTTMLRIRIEPEFKQQLEEAVKKGKAQSISDLMRSATKKFLLTNN